MSLITAAVSEIPTTPPTKLQLVLHDLDIAPAVPNRDVPTAAKADEKVVTPHQDATGLGDASQFDGFRQSTASKSGIDLVA